MKIGFFLKCSALALVGVGIWAALQSFKPAGNTDAGKTLTLSYDLETTAFTAPLKATDNTKLSDFEKIAGMVVTTKARNLAVFEPSGNFQISVTPLSVPITGGQRSPYEDVSFTMNPSGITTNKGEKFPYEPGELEELQAEAKFMAAYTGGNCAYRAADIQAMAKSLTTAGAKMSKIGAYTVFTLGNQETILDLTNNLLISVITRSNGQFESETYYEYTTGTSGDGREGDGGCGVLKRITTRQVKKSGSGVPVVDYVIRELSNVLVTYR